jgi:hypothetical protein
MLVLTNLQKQIEFLGEQRVIVLQTKAEERKRFDRGAATHDHFRPSLRQQIDRGELLKYAYRIGGTENGDRAGETDTVRSCRCCSENDRRSGIKEFSTMVLADAKGVQAHLIGQLDLLHELSQTVRRAHSETAVVKSGCEAVNPNLHQ